MRIEIHASDETVEIFVEADTNELPEEQRRFVLINHPTPPVQPGNRRGRETKKRKASVAEASARPPTLLNVLYREDSVRQNNPFSLRSREPDNLGTFVSPPHQYGLRSRYDRLRDRGMLTNAEITARLGICESTVKRWVRHGLIARHAYSGQAYLYEPPGSNLPPKHFSRWDRLVDRAAAFRRTPDSRCTLPAEGGGI